MKKQNITGKFDNSPDLSFNENDFINPEGTTIMSKQTAQKPRNSNF